AAEAALAAISIDALDAAEKSLLDEVGSVGAHLVAKEPMNRVVVTLEQLLARSLVALAPRVEQLYIGKHHRRSLSRRLGDRSLTSRSVLVPTIAIARGGIRTRIPKEGILSPPRLPVSPPEQAGRHYEMCGPRATSAAFDSLTRCTHASASD